MKRTQFNLALALLAISSITFRPTFATPQMSSTLTQAEKAEFYHLSEGSEIFPLSWIKALNSTSTGKPFLEDVDRFGLIPDPTNPDGLPVGLTAEETRDTRFSRVGKMVGVNCAACHVNEVTYQGALVRIDGAPSRFNLQAFYADLFASAQALFVNPREFVAFLVRLSGVSSPFDAQPMSGGLSNSVRHVFSSSTLSQSTGASRQQMLEAQVQKLLPGLKQKPPVELSEDFQRRKDSEIQIDQTLRDLSDPLLTPLNKNSPLSLLNTKFDKFRLSTKELSEAEVLAAMPATAPVDLTSASFKPLSVFDEVGVVLSLLQARIEFLSKLSSLKFQSTPELSGRVDAFGNARNIVFDARHALPPNSPVSFPHLWGLKNFAWLHWDSNTNSIMERNIGQAIGLGAVVNMHTKASTLLPRNIFRLEVLARKLAPPLWPSPFPKIDTAKAQDGKIVFDQNCATCHSIQSSTQNDVDMALNVIGTDPKRATSFGIPVDAKPMAEAIATVMHDVKMRAYADSGIDDSTGKLMEGNKTPVWRTTLKYRARSLDGVWATAPYLHNDSVPTLADLLKPPAQRPKLFLVLSREYDPVNVGLLTQHGSSMASFPSARRSEVFDSSLTGNDNRGHEYGTTLSDKEKVDLLEYLKSI